MNGYLVTLTLITFECKEETVTEVKKYVTFASSSANAVQTVLTTTNNRNNCLEWDFKELKQGDSIDAIYVKHIEFIN